MHRSPRQTLSYLRTMFEERGISPQRRLGQNFLIDLNLHDLIVRTSEIGSQDVILEVGPGAGALTTRMVELAGFVLAVEVDREMAALTGEAVSGCPNVRVLNADALMGKNRLNQEMLDIIGRARTEAAGGDFKLVANLPYSIATPLITNLLVHPDHHPTTMVVTIQLELAHRMVAEPAQEAYGGLSVLVQALADVELVRLLPPSVFWPTPRVESAIIQIVANPDKRSMISDLSWFHSVVRKVFLHRRKNLRGVLYSEWRSHWDDKQEVDGFLQSLGLSETGIIRAETMNVEEFRNLADKLKKHIQSKGDGRAELEGFAGDSEDQGRGDASEP